MNRPNYADHTFAPWRIVGDKRVVAPETTWKKPLSWNREAKVGVRQRVLVDVDVFEDWRGSEGEGEMTCHKTGEPLCINSTGHVWPISYPAMSDGDDWDVQDYTMADVRYRLFELIDSTPNLDWLLVTERPENVAAMMPPLGWIKHPCPKHVSQFRLECPACNAKNSTPVTRKNLWLGVRITDQQTANDRIPHLLRVPAKVRFVDAVLRGPVDLDCYAESGCSRNWLDDEPGIDWLTVSGESGPHARPMHPDWVRSLQKQCTAAGVPFWFDGWGDWTWDINHPWGDHPDAKELHVFTNPACCMIRLGKAAAGRALDGREWEEVPS